MNSPVTTSGRSFAESVPFIIVEIQQHAGFVFDLQALSPERSIVLFERAEGPTRARVEDDEVPF